MNTNKKCAIIAIRIEITNPFLFVIFFKKKLPNFFTIKIVYISGLFLNTFFVVLPGINQYKERKVVIRLQRMTKLNHKKITSNKPDFLSK